MAFAARVQILLHSLALAVPHVASQGSPVTARRPESGRVGAVPRVTSQGSPVSVRRFPSLVAGTSRGGARSGHCVACVRGPSRLHRGPGARPMGESLRAGVAVELLPAGASCRPHLRGGSGAGSPVAPPLGPGVGSARPWATCDGRASPGYCAIAPAAHRRASHGGRPHHGPEPGYCATAPAAHRRVTHGGRLPQGAGPGYCATVPAAHRRVTHGGHPLHDTAARDRRLPAWAA